MGEVAVGEEALRKDRSVLKGRLMKLKERRAREEERCKEGWEGVEKEIALGQEKVEGVEMLKNALRGESLAWRAWRGMSPGGRRMLRERKRDSGGVRM